MTKHDVARHWSIARSRDGYWELKHPGAQGIFRVADGLGVIEGLRDLLNAQFPTERPSMIDRTRAWMSAQLLRWSRRLDPDFWPEGRHGMHRPEPGGSWLPAGPRTGVATYSTAKPREGA